MGRKRLAFEFIVEGVERFPWVHSGVLVKCLIVHVLTRVWNSKVVDFLKIWPEVHLIRCQWISISVMKCPLAISY